MIHNAVKIIPAHYKLAQALRSFSQKKTLVITTEGWMKRGLKDLLGEGFSQRIEYSKVLPNPTYEDVFLAYQEVPKSFDQILAVGGGSALDFAKGFAALHGVSGDYEAVLAHLLKAEPLPEADIVPILAVPTTSGTGSEVTQWGTLWGKASRKKHSIADPRLYPEVALLDASLTCTLPEETTLFTALDALSHACESIWNCNSQFYSEAMAIRAIQLIHDNLKEVLEKPKVFGGRKILQEASLLAGLASSQTKTAIAHSISYPLTGRWGVPHGLACSFTLPAIIEKTDFEKEDLRVLKALYQGFRVNSKNELLEVWYSFYQSVGVPEAVKAWIPEDLSSLRGELMHPQRAGLFLSPMDDDRAFDIVVRAKNL